MSIRCGECEKLAIGGMGYDTGEWRYYCGEHMPPHAAKIDRLKAEVERLTRERDEAVASEEKTHLEATLAAIEIKRLREAAPPDITAAAARIVEAVCWKPEWDEPTADTRQIGARYAELGGATNFPESERQAKREFVARAIEETFKPTSGDTNG